MNIGINSLTQQSPVPHTSNRQHRGDATKLRAERNTALTVPVDTIQNQHKAPPLVPSTQPELCDDSPIVALVSLLARRAAEHDYAQLLKREQRKEKSDPRTPL
jgi:hypothetical protein